MMGLQELYEHQGFIVIAYYDEYELAKHDARGMTDGRVEGSLEGIITRIIGPATQEEWEAQERLSGDWGTGVKYIAFRKVIAE